MISLQAIQQSIADDIGIDVHPNMTAIDRQRARQTSDLQTVIAFQWDHENNHPADSPASRRACARYVRQNVRRMKREARQQHQDAVDSRVDAPDPDGKSRKCKFVFLIFLLEAFFSWLFGRWLDAWWDARNKISGPDATIAIAVMLAGMECCAVVAECRPVVAGDDGDDGGTDNPNDDDYLD